MIRIATASALLALASPALFVPAIAQQQGPADDAPSAAPATPVPPLSVEHRMVLRCGAAFAMVAFGQENGNAEALQYPPIEPAGANWFAVEVDRVMREAELSDAQIVAALSAEADAIFVNDQLDDIMPACLTLLGE